MSSASPVSLVGLRSGSLLEAYRIFDEVVACGSMSQAAWNLDLDVSVVSRQISTLERAFDCTMLERHRRGVRVSEAGALIAQHVRRVLGLEGRLHQELDDLRQLRAGSIRIAATDGAISGPLSRTVVPFLRRNPAVRIELFQASSEQVVPSLHRGDAELGAGLEIAPEPGIEIVARLPEILAAVVSPRHRLARRAKVSLSELGDQPLGMFERNSGVARALRRLVAQGAPPLQPSLVTNSLDALKQMAAGGVGIALLCPHSAQQELQDGRLVAVPLHADGPVRINLEFCVLRGERRSFVLEAFIAELLSRGGVARPDGEPRAAGAPRATRVRTHPATAP